VGECFFWYRPTRVVPDKRPLNGCVCVVSKSLIKTKRMSVVVSSRPNDFQQADACTAPKHKRTLLYDLRMHHINRLCYHVAMHNWSDHLQCTDVQSVYDLFLRDVWMLLHTHTHTHLTALFPGLPGWACTRKVKLICACNLLDLWIRER